MHLHNASTQRILSLVDATKLISDPRLFPLPSFPSPLSPPQDNRGGERGSGQSGLSDLNYRNHEHDRSIPGRLGHGPLQVAADERQRVHPHDRRHRNNRRSIHLLLPNGHRLRSCRWVLHSAFHFTYIYCSGYEFEWLCPAYFLYKLKLQNQMIQQQQSNHMEVQAMFNDRGFLSLYLRCFQEAHCQF